MPNKIIVEIEALDYTVNERDVAEALKSHFPNMPTRVQEIRPTDATEPPCTIARECHFGQDGKCLRGGVCR